MKPNRYAGRDGRDEQYFQYAFSQGRAKQIAKQFIQVVEQKDFNIDYQRFCKGQSLSLSVKLIQPSYRNTKIPNNLKTIPQEIQITFKKNTSQQTPLIFFLSEGMIEYDLKPFRDYCQEILGDVQWSSTFNFVQLVKAIPTFLQKCFQKKVNTKKIPSFDQLFDIDHIYNWKFCSTFLTKIGIYEKKHSLLLIDGKNSQIIILKKTHNENLYSVSDYIKGDQILNMYKKKTSSSAYLLQLKISYKKYSGNYGIVFESQNSQQLIKNIIKCSETGNSDDNVQIVQQCSDQQEYQDKNTSQIAEQKKIRSRKLETMGPNELWSEIKRFEQYLQYDQNKMTFENVLDFDNLLQYYIHENRSYPRHKKQCDVCQNKREQLSELIKLINDQGNGQKSRRGKQQKDRKQEFKRLIDLFE